MNRQVEKLEELKKIALENKVPIIMDDTLEVLTEILQTHKPKKILEIGTALGYSSFFLAQSKQVKSIITLEKDLKRFEFAKNILFKFDNVKCINTSAFYFVSDKKFDVIILDGPKSHQDQLFDKFKNNLKNGGMFFIDNLYFINRRMRFHRLKACRVQHYTGRGLFCNSRFL